MTFIPLPIDVICVWATFIPLPIDVICAWVACIALPILVVICACVTFIPLPIDVICACVTCIALKLFFAVAERVSPPRWRREIRLRGVGVGAAMAGVDMTGFKPVKFAFGHIHSKAFGQ